MGDMRDEFRHHKQAMEQVRNTCGCGQRKGHPSHLACNACFLALPDELRVKFLDVSRHRRGSPTWHSLRRQIERTVHENVARRAQS